MSLCSTFLVGMCLVLSYLNYRGLTVVGHSLLASALAVLLPFILLSLLAIPKVGDRVADMLAVVLTGVTTGQQETTTNNPVPTHSVPFF
jgi:hypothetical protein